MVKSPLRFIFFNAVKKDSKDFELETSRDKTKLNKTEE